MRRATGLEYISVAEAKARLSEKLRGVINRGRRYVITSHGRPKAVIIDYREYLSLVEGGEPQNQREISIDKWEKGKGERRKVVESISSLFRDEKLTRKGQKGYKRDAVGKMGKDKKQS